MILCHIRSPNRCDYCHTHKHILTEHTLMQTPTQKKVTSWVLMSRKTITMCKMWKFVSHRASWMENIFLHLITLIISSHTSSHPVFFPFNTNPCLLSSLCNLHLLMARTITSVNKVRSREASDVPEVTLGNFIKAGSKIK